MAKTLPVNSIIHGDCREVMAEWPDGCVDMCVTSPPYWQLRNYGVKGQLGLEKTPEEYVEKMVAVFVEVKRVLADHGTLWLNMGDSYSNNGKHGGASGGKNYTSLAGGYTRDVRSWGLPAKNLMGIPWRLAFALQADGWYLRQDIIEEVELYCPGCGYVLEERVWRYSQDQEIIWKKPNPMPESVRDRCTKAHEYIFLLSKKPRYYYDQEVIREDVLDASRTRCRAGFPPETSAVRDAHNNYGEGFQRGPGYELNPNGRNRRSVWTIPTQAMSEAHFATFPEQLVEPCILAGCPKEVCIECGKPRERIIETKQLKRVRPNQHVKYQGGGPNGQPDQTRQGVQTTTTGFTDCGCNKAFRPGIVFDPFGGSGTVGYVAARLKRDYVLIELSAEYIEKIAEPRLQEAETGVTVAERKAGQKGLFE